MPKRDSQFAIERLESGGNIAIENRNALDRRVAAVPERTQGLLVKMFGDPHLLEKPERGELLMQLRECVAAHPEVSDLRVLLGMALCVNYEVPDAIEELREGVRLAPDSFIANLKMGELWMRLRVMDKAEEHTRCAAKLASNMAQTELARRQAASIRAMTLAGVERGGYQSPLLVVTRLARAIGKASGLWKPKETEAIATGDGDQLTLSEMTGDLGDAEG